MNYGSPYSWQAWGHLLDSVRTGESAFKLTHGVPLFEYLSQHPEDAERFHSFMAEIPDLRAAAASYDYSGAQAVVDVGGGEAATLIAILKNNPEVRGILFDLPDVVSKAENRLKAEGLLDRCEVKGGDFFQTIPEGGDVYVLSNILHDWEDEEAITILRNCRHAMIDSGRLLVVEGIVPEGNEPSNATMLDLQMLTTVGGLQRTEREFRDLFSRTGFQLVQVLPAGTLNIIEARPL